MNQRQKIILTVGGGLLALAILFPPCDGSNPWHAPIRVPGGAVYGGGRGRVGYVFLPRALTQSDLTLRAGELAVEIVLIGALTGAIAALCRKSRKPPREGRQGGPTGEEAEPPSAGPGHDAAGASSPAEDETAEATDATDPAPVPDDTEDFPLAILVDEDRVPEPQPRAAGPAPEEPQTESESARAADDAAEPVAEPDPAPVAHDTEDSWLVFVTIAAMAIVAVSLLCIGLVLHDSQKTGHEQPSGDEPRGLLDAIEKHGEKMDAQQGKGGFDADWDQLEKERAKSNLQAALDEAQKAVDAQQEPSVAVDHGLIMGRVLSAPRLAEPELADFVALDIGSNQGVSRHMRFEVLRAGERIAVVRTESVRNLFSTARVIEGRAHLIRRGQPVRSLPSAPRASPPG